MAARLRIATVVVAAVIAFTVACALQLAPAQAEDAPTVRHVAVTIPVGSGSDVLVQDETELDLHPGDIVELSFSTEAPVGLLGVTVHLCQTGFTDWTETLFGYAGQTATRCVYEPGIVDGTALTPDDTTYELGPDSYNGLPQESSLYDVVVGAGHVEWHNADDVASSLDCDATHPCDVVTKVETTEGDVAVILTLDYAADVVVSTTTTTTSTTAPPVTDPPTTAPVAAVPVASVAPATAVPAGNLALTGSSTRDLLSIALVVIAVGLLALAQSIRRFRRT